MWTRSREPGSGCVRALHRGTLLYGICQEKSISQGESSVLVPVMDNRRSSTSIAPCVDAAEIRAREVDGAGFNRGVE